ncbi:MAG: acyl-CoA dehydrogenase family protein [Candidatus Thermoplasmatota archaeon]|nr:acyl-CoA dehydrogenase family protein [Candidatus Thermoplasmatota archaeon]
MVGLEDEMREMLLNGIREYAARNFPVEYLLKMDREGELPKEKIKEMYDPTKLGIHLLLVPQEFGGFGAGNYDMYKVCETLAGIDLGLATSVFSTFLGLDPIRVGGTPEQRSKWFGRVAAEGLLCAYGATEAEAGSDLGSLKTIAVPVIEDGKTVGYRISGNKQWISNAGMADLYLILARDTKAVGWFIVERGAEGMEFNNPEDKHGIRLANTVAFSMDNVYVPLENLVGMEEGQGLTQAQAVFANTRLMVAAFGLGCGWEALGRAISYSQGRIQAGGPLSEKQGYMHKLIVPHAVKLEAARAYIEEVAFRLDKGGEADLSTEGAIAKLSASESGNAAAEASIQAMGGYGYVREMVVEKVKRDVRITMIYEGTSEILEMTIARNRWQEHLKSRSQFYNAMAADMEALHAKDPRVGADVCALGLRALNAVFEHCRVQKLTRNQHVLMRLGELSCLGETSAAFCRAAASENYSRAIRFDRHSWQSMSRLHSRNSAQAIAEKGIEMIIGYGSASASALSSEMNLAKILDAGSGTMDDMDIASEALKKAFKKT